MHNLHHFANGLTLKLSGQDYHVTFIKIVETG